MGESDNDYREQSEFNMAISTNNRINESLYRCNEYNRTKNFSEWFSELMVLFAECSIEMKGNPNILYESAYGESVVIVEPKNLSKDRDEFKKTIFMISELEPLISIHKRKESNLNNYKLFKKLLTLDIFLKKVLKDSGLLIKLKDDPRMALGRT